MDKTRKLCLAYSLIIKDKPGGIVVYIPKNKFDLLSKATADLSFGFIVDAVSPTYFIEHELNHIQNEEGYSLMPHKESLNNGRMMFHEANILSLKQCTKVARSHNLADEVGLNRASEVYDVHRKRIEIERLNKNSTISDILPVEGCYEINSPEGNFEILYSKNWSHESFALIDIDLDSLKESGQLVGNRSFELRLKNKGVILNYLFKGLKKQDVGSITVRYNKKNLDFKDPQERELPNGSVAVSVMSVKPFPLQKSYGVQKLLITLNGESEESIVKSIASPYPSSRLVLKSGKIEGKHLAVDLYINTK